MVLPLCLALGVGAPPSREGQPEIDAVAIPIEVRTRMAHATVQAVADRLGIDVLHIKGASLDPDLNPGRPESADADVLVRPAHVRRFVKGLGDYGWRLWCDFDEGSLFEHAASFHHEHFGMLDCHQNFPGLHHDPAAAFDYLWATRVERDLAGVPCPAPGPMGEHLVTLLHAARTFGRELDVTNHWHALTDADRHEITALAERLGATTGIQVALGHLDELDGPEAALWRGMRDNSDRLGEWRARWAAATGVRERARLTLRAVKVNRFALGLRLGHPPSRAEVRREWFARADAGFRAIARRARRGGAASSARTGRGEGSGEGSGKGSGEGCGEGSGEARRS